MFSLERWSREFLAPVFGDPKWQLMSDREVHFWVPMPTVDRPNRSSNTYAVKLSDHVINVLTGGNKDRQDQIGRRSQSIATRIFSMNPPSENTGATISIELESEALDQ